MTEQKRVKLTAGRVADFQCPEGKTQAFLWDTDAPSLALRVSAKGRKTYISEARLNGVNIRTPIGVAAAWTLHDARVAANENRGQIDRGIDPREVAREKVAAVAAQKAEAAARSVTVADVWPTYMAEGKPRKRDAWKPRYVSDLHKAASPGGEPLKRGKGTTRPGHLWPLMGLYLAEIDVDVVRDWYASEKKRAPVQAARAVAMFSGFLGWCATRKEYRALVDRDCARASNLADMLPGVRRRTDALEQDQLSGWFAGTDKLSSRTARAYLQALVLTGARREELAGLRWADVDFQWRKLTIADKVDATRVIPLTPYLATLIQGLSREPDNPHVFAAKTASGRISEPRSPHARVLADAGIPHVSIHGLRRTFSLMAEAAGAPAGAIAQIMGHRPSAVAEGYRPRPIDVLRGYATMVEAFILDKAGIAFDPMQASAGGLRVVTA